MTQTEALKLALEALELEDMACRYEKDPTPEHIAKAITAIREALAQPDVDRRSTESKETFDQQEPVAVVSGYYGGQCVILPTNPARIFNSGTALYTTPPHRKPLTDEEIDAIPFRALEIGPTESFREFARAIEAAHGIKE